MACIELLCEVIAEARFKSGLSFIAEKLLFVPTRSLWHGCMKEESESILKSGAV